LSALLGEERILKNALFSLFLLKLHMIYYGTKRERNIGGRYQTCKIKKKSLKLMQYKVRKE